MATRAEIIRDDLTKSNSAIKELYAEVKEHYPQAKLHHGSVEYSIDITIVDPQNDERSVPISIRRDMINSSSCYNTKYATRVNTRWSHGLDLDLEKRFASLGGNKTRKENYSYDFVEKHIKNVEAVFREVCAIQKFRDDYKDAQEQERKGLTDYISEFTGVEWVPEYKGVKCRDPQWLYEATFNKTGNCYGLKLSKLSKDQFNAILEIVK